MANNNDKQLYICPYCANGYTHKELVANNNKCPNCGNRYDMNWRVCGQLGEEW